jgi:hydrogenase expression/formation protein HypC
MGLGIPGRIVDIISEDLNLATVEVAGVRRTANIAFVVDDEHPAAACLDDWVLMRFGFAMQRIDAKEAEATLALLDELGELQARRDATQEPATADEKCALVRHAA